VQKKNGSQVVEGEVCVQGGGKGRPEEKRLARKGKKKKKGASTNVERKGERHEPREKETSLSKKGNSEKAGLTPVEKRKGDVNLAERKGKKGRGLTEPKNGEERDTIAGKEKKNAGLKGGVSSKRKSL